MISQEATCFFFFLKIKSLPDFSSLLYNIFLAAYLLFVQDYILKMRMMNFEIHCCQLQKQLSRFRHSITIKGNPAP